MDLQFTKELTDTGLSTEQAIVYEVLVKEGELPASKIAKRIPAAHALSRPLVYRVLEELIQNGLVEKHDPEAGVATFLAKHPTQLSELLNAQKDELERKKEQFEAVAGRLASLYNLTSGKPGVQFFEGRDGVWEVLNDSLTATEEILTFADIEAIEQYIPKINEKYVKKRDERGIKKRALILDTPFARKFLADYHKDTTHIKLIDMDTDPFNTVMQIYNEKISYITLTKKYFVGVLITDPYIHYMHRYLFEYIWKNSEGLDLSSSKASSA